MAIKVISDTTADTPISIQKELNISEEVVAATRASIPNVSVIGTFDTLRYPGRRRPYRQSQGANGKRPQR